MKEWLKKSALLMFALALVVGALPGLAGQKAAAAEGGIKQAYESVFAGDNVIDVNVTITDEDWDSILASPLDKDYKNVTVDIDGTVIENVGFSTKGNLTLKSVAAMTDSDRYSFRLKFDKYDKSQTWLGLDKLSLNNNYSDPSYLREYLHYEALKAIGLDSPLTVFVNLYVNGELYGFYTGVEAVDDSYLARNVGADYESGVLYDTDAGSTLVYDENSDYDTITRDLGIKDDKASLKYFIQVLNEMPDGEKGDIESVLDVDSALKYIAANAVLGNYDSYNGDKAQNYMLYGDASGKYTVIPWDYNMSFNGYTATGGRSGSGTGSNTNAVTASIDVPVLGINMEDAPLINNLLEVEEYKARYLNYVEQLVDYMETIQDRITELGDLISPYVEADPTKFYTMEQFQSNLTYSAQNETDGAFGGMTPPDGTVPAQGENGLTPPEGFEGQEPPEGFDGMTPPDGTQGQTPPTGAEQDGQRPDPGNAGQGNGFPGGAGGGGLGGNGGVMASGSIMTFALNRLANLQEQLGREVTALPETSAEVTLPNTEANGISIVVDGQRVVFSDQKAVKENARVLSPVYGVAEALGAKLTWDAAARTATLVKDDTTVVLTIGSNIAYVNGTAVELDVPAKTINSRTVVPVRFLGEALGMDVKWNQATATVTLTSQN
ncbi:CotH kinase family protein [Paenibacillus sp. CAU 1782]